jgi:TPP-dependent pyruvate/acetoin dehydrogenase alpha subunit
MDIIAATQAVKYARNWAVDQDNGPLLLEFVTYRYGGHSMSDPGTTYRTREEVQRMRSTQDPIRGLQRYLEEWCVFPFFTQIWRQGKVLMRARRQGYRDGAGPQEAR